LILDSNSVEAEAALVDASLYPNYEPESGIIEPTKS
jgi:hypothetical protein